MRPARLFFIVVAMMLWLAACARLVSGLDESYYEKVTPKSGSTQGSVLFSNNVNGETQPCGCNKFPLGGLEQVAGHFHQVGLTGPIIYVDSGDMLFPSPNLPKHLHASHQYTAEKLVEAAEKLGLKFFVPGDQDFALGKKWLADLSHKAKFTFLIANARENSPFKHRAWAKIAVGDKNLVFIGITDPELLSNEYAALFSSPEVAIESALSDADPEKNDIVILLSHAGMDKDRRFAKLFPRLDWIVGSHTQSFTQRASEEGNTKIVQGLSRNHYIGQIQFGLGSDDTQVKFQLLETREEMAKAVDPNPMRAFMQEWREGVAKVQKSEQVALSGQNVSKDPLPTFNSCLECHQKQTNFWQGTAHANAWHTLVAKGSDNDASCVGCHSTGFQNPQGFTSTAERVRFAGNFDAEKLKAYSEALVKNYAGVKSVRALSAAQRKTRAQGQMKLINEHGVSHEYGNVQCLNCHDKNRDHPFDGSLQSNGADMGAKCMTCHTADQSPDWYKNGAANKAVVDAKIKSVACPSGK
jgi:hypothetical protein